MTLEQELAAFAAQKDELLRMHPGKFALVHGGSVLGVFDRAENAYLEGLKSYARGQFLVKLISRLEEDGYRDRVQQSKG